ncbi:MAG: ABC transporter permease [Microbacteriaceae bacterium]
MDSTPQERARSRTRPLDITLRVLGAGPIVILVLLCIVVAVARPVFLSPINLQNVLLQSSAVAILAIGSLIVIVTGGIDLSIGSTMALATVMGWLVFQQVGDGGGILVVLAMIALGLAVGLVNGLAYVVGRIPHPFIVTLAMLSIAQSIGTVITHGQPLPGMPPLVNELGRGFLGPIPTSAVLVTVVAVLAHLFLKRSQWGRWIFAVGGDVEAAKRMSIPVPRVLVSTYVLCGGLAGLAGVLLAGNIGGASATVGQSAGGLLDAIAAVIIGGASILGGRGSVWNCLIGALLLGVIRNGLALVGASPFLQGLLVGATILVAVQLDVVRTMVEKRIRTIQANVGAL